mmetsp:Transcript_41258/g.36596  ORF Transcript_41258/g.36596 Transcript_41258/m.36596 type:complete len:251 (-) Transcript_41258:57-809(-)
MVGNFLQQSLCLVDVDLIIENVALNEGFVDLVVDCIVVGGKSIQFFEFLEKGKGCVDLTSLDAARDIVLVDAVEQLFGFFVTLMLEIVCENLFTNLHLVDFGEKAKKFLHSVLGEHRELFLDHIKQYLGENVHKIVFKESVDEGVEGVSFYLIHVFGSHEKVGGFLVFSGVEKGFEPVVGGLGIFAVDPLELEGLGLLRGECLSDMTNGIHERAGLIGEVLEGLVEVGGYALEKVLHGLGELGLEGLRVS